MALLPLIPLAQFPNELADAVRRGLSTRMLSSTTPVQVWAHRPEVAAAWLAVLDQMHNHGVLDERLRELVRLRIASFTTCRACQTARKSATVTDADLACLASSDPRFSEAERAALRFAELFAADPLAIDEAIFADLRAWFSVAQIVELNMFCALMLAGGRMTRAQQAYEA
ncbi:carboxymuconolactone decarboxylase family protein [Paraburkholderia xenovorans LB400]|uniref:Carboxymuconolactone decarboxylase n=1 Tax=Paraburkholderia xenovorans (strain LB400) TaxID=266265 RepID=Q13HE3_PARXL|nr:carboxymuconolactone decarboxylase family protein [Paraburkholderia xenovorans]ABE36496.1 Putative carboxymuconolactone decarboxylase [Paraburkholderia xenovorans LB400]AIP35008.1 carboxymuconolactone decarboxylase family protein [Paraburkholderia xenovorans LB400]